MRRIINGGVTYALVLTIDDFQAGHRFVSEADWALQVGLLSLPTGHSIAAHAHLPRSGGHALSAQEFIFVINGAMEVNFFDQAGRRFGSDVIRQGEALFQIAGGHAFQFSEETQLIEVKSGPYRGRESDKVQLESDQTSISIGPGSTAELE